MKSSGYAVVIAWLAPLALAFTLFWPAALWAERIPVTAAPIYLNPENIHLRQVGELEFLAGFRLSSGDPRFGGWSGLSLAPDGRSVLMVSDTGNWLTARFRLDAEGRLQGLDDADIHRLTGADGRPLSDNKLVSDSEAVERAADGALLVSFERRHRILRYPPGPQGLAATPRPLALPKAVAEMPPNGGFEAIAPLPDGRVLALSEKLKDANGDNIGWLLAPDGRADEVRFEATGIFSPTDATALPNGDVLVVERRYSPIGGPGARLVWLRAADLHPGARFTGHELMQLALPFSVDNEEGLAMAPAPGGGWLIYLISDDNFNALQRTLLMQFRWDGPQS